jgi:hypothetical protein
MSNGVCRECRGPIQYGRYSSVQFCSEKCRYKARDRARYATDAEGARERARAYYWANRERVLEKAAARRGRERPVERTTCSECGELLEGRQRIICGASRCRDARFRRLHPEAYAERERAKVERRRLRRQQAREAS